jgi:hypothetical protein
VSTLREALHEAGYQTSQDRLQDRLREIAMQALVAHPTNPLKRRAAIMGAIGDDPDLLLLLFNRYVVDATDRLVATVRNDMVVNARTGRPQAETHSHVARAVPFVSGDRVEAETRPGTVPADDTRAGDHCRPDAREVAVSGVGAQARDRQPVEAQKMGVPGAGAQAGDRAADEAHSILVPGAGARAVAAVVRLSLLDTFRINGQPLGDVTPAEARLWAEARGRQARRDARFIELIIAGLPDGMPIRRFRRDDEAQAAFAQALQEVD